MVSLFVTAVT